MVSFTDECDWRIEVMGENPQEIREFLPPAYNEIQISCFPNK